MWKTSTLKNNHQPTNEQHSHADNTCAALEFIMFDINHACAPSMCSTSTSTPTPTHRHRHTDTSTSVGWYTNAAAGLSVFVVCQFGSKSHNIRALLYQANKYFYIVPTHRLFRPHVRTLGAVRHRSVSCARCEPRALLGNVHSSRATRRKRRTRRTTRRHDVSTTTQTPGGCRRRHRQQCDDALSGASC